MAMSYGYPIAMQTKLLVQGLTKKSFKTVQAEIKELSNQFGDEAHAQLLRCLLEEIDFSSKKNQQHTQKDHFKAQLLVLEILELSTKTNFSNMMCSALQVFFFSCFSPSRPSAS